jgi:predicted HicB family RNase H-like nuclease
VDHYLTVCAQRQEDPERPFSGKLNLRLEPNCTVRRRWLLPLKVEA